MEKAEFKNALKVKQVADTMAIEDMYLDREFISKMLKVASGELSSDELRQEVLNRYAR
ncbi:MAG: antitoxin VbhA family protein [Lachnospiraceae bacterium]|nr:antitoxin VbhA family protein [Lachnospiraceae bacterium]